jgi:hypothetical protein
MNIHVMTAGEHRKRFEAENVFLIDGKNAKEKRFITRGRHRTH